MGISGLINFVNGAVSQGNISSFAHKTGAVDISCWLHRGLYGCAYTQAQGAGSTDGCFNYVYKYLKLLESHHIKVILVFDGAPLPAKEDTNTVRRDARHLAKAKASRAIEEGRSQDATKLLQTATEVTWTIVSDVIAKVRAHFPSVDIIVAPHESDAQLAYLAREGMADFVITEDSDLIVYGVQNVVFKLADGGQCQIFDASKLHTCLPHSFRLNRKEETSAENFDFVKFRRVISLFDENVYHHQSHHFPVCILAGCDYLPVGLPGVGLKRAVLFFSKTSNSELTTILRKIPAYLNLTANASKNVDDDFIRLFIRAERTFLHQVVFDPVTRKRRHLTEFVGDDVVLTQQSTQTTESGSSEGESQTDLSYAGVLELSPRKSTHLAVGNRNPRTFERAATFCPDTQSHKTSLWRCRSSDDVKIRHSKSEGKISSHFAPKPSSKPGTAFVFDSPAISSKGLNVNVVKPTTSKPKRLPSTKNSEQKPNWSQVDSVKRMWQVMEKSKNSTKSTDHETTDVYNKGQVLNKSTMKPFKQPRKSDDTVNRIESPKLDEDDEIEILETPSTSMKPAQKSQDVKSSPRKNMKRSHPFFRTSTTQGAYKSPRVQVEEVMKPVNIDSDAVIKNSPKAVLAKRRAAAIRETARPDESEGNQETGENDEEKLDLSDLKYGGFMEAKVGRESRRSK